MTLPATRAAMPSFRVVETPGIFMILSIFGSRVSWGRFQGYNIAAMGVIASKHSRAGRHQINYRAGVGKLVPRVKFRYSIRFCKGVTWTSN
jgi:hypothetical protein